MLCSDRVGQVTKTYHDIKAVTHLLEEVRDTQQMSRLTEDPCYLPYWTFLSVNLDGIIVCQCNWKTSIPLYLVIVALKLWLYNMCHIFTTYTSLCMFLYKGKGFYFAERAGSGASSANRSISPEAESRNNRTQWNAGWAAWDCKRRGTNPPPLSEFHCQCVYTYSVKWCCSLHLLDCSTTPWALHARRPPSVLRQHRGDRERWITIPVGLHTHTHTYAHKH